MVPMLGRVTLHNISGMLLLKGQGFRDCDHCAHHKRVLQALLELNVNMGSILTKDAAQAMGHNTMPTTKSFPRLPWRRAGTRTPP